MKFSVKLVLICNLVISVCAYSASAISAGLFSATDKLSSKVLIPNKYDKLFKSSWARWMPGHQYQWLKAQCWQESRFKPLAVSPVGAKGLCQFMPGTAKEVSKALNTRMNVYSPKWSIEAAAYYDHKLYRFWFSERPIHDRLNLMLASYNAGAGNVLKSQRKCNGEVLYQEIIACLPSVTGHHSKETIDYVRNINGYYKSLRIQHH